MWCTTQIALMRHVEKTALVRVVAEFQNAKYQNGEYLKSLILKQYVEFGHENVSYYDSKIIAINYIKSLLIEVKRPMSNTHDQSVPLKLFN